MPKPSKAEHHRSNTSAEGSLTTPFASFQMSQPDLRLALQSVSPALLLTVWPDQQSGITGRPSGEDPH